MGKNPAQKAKAAATKEVKKEEVKKAKASAPAKKKKVQAAAKSEQNCRIASCKRELRAKGYCRVHYKKWRQGEYGKARYKTCSDLGCRKPMVMNRHGYCEEHFQNYYVKGMAVTKAPVAEAPAKEEKAAATA